MSDLTLGQCLGLGAPTPYWGTYQSLQTPGKPPTTFPLPGSGGAPATPIPRVSYSDYAQSGGYTPPPGVKLTFGSSSGDDRRMPVDLWRAAAGGPSPGLDSRAQQWEAWERGTGLKKDYTDVLPGVSTAREAAEAARRARDEAWRNDRFDPQAKDRALETARAYDAEARRLAERQRTQDAYTAALSEAARGDPRAVAEAQRLAAELRRNPTRPGVPVRRSVQWEEATSGGYAEFQQREMQRRGVSTTRGAGWDPRAESASARRAREAREQAAQEKARREREAWAASEARRKEIDRKRRAEFEARQRAAAERLEQEAQARKAEEQAARARERALAQRTAAQAAEDQRQYRLAQEAVRQHTPVAGPGWVPSPATQARQATQGLQARAFQPIPRGMAVTLRGLGSQAPSDAVDVPPTSSCPPGYRSGPIITDPTSLDRAGKPITFRRCRPTATPVAASMPPLPPSPANAPRPLSSVRPRSPASPARPTAPRPRVGAASAPASTPSTAGRGSFAAPLVAAGLLVYLLRA